jgi:hypothetical protein
MMCFKLKFPKRDLRPEELFCLEMDPPTMPMTISTFLHGLMHVLPK